MNSPKEPEPGPGSRADRRGPARDAERILRMTSREGEEFVWVGWREEFING
jgi:hypothetical protein